MNFKQMVDLMKKAFDFGAGGYKNGLKCGGAYNKEFLSWLKEIGVDSKHTVRLLSEYNKGWNTENLNNWDWETSKEKYPVGSGQKVDVTQVKADKDTQDSDYGQPGTHRTNETLKGTQTPTLKESATRTKNKGSGECVRKLNEKYDDEVSGYFNLYLK